jgi:SAM-dependent methyltransferase
MRWIVKAALQKGISALPNEQAVNYRFQRYVTRTLPRSGSNLRLHIELPSRHLGMYRKHAARPLSEATFFEFGAGWDLVGPLVYYALGVEKQTLIDIRPNLRFELVKQAWADLNQRRDEIEEVSGMPARDLGAEPPDSPEALEARFGISYLAPYDARDTGLPAESIDFISSTDTMEHIPAPDIEKILREAARLLRPDGLISCTLDLRDLYSYFDSSISPYNFLKFSDRTWRLANSGIHYQNRLRLRDYLNMFEAAGLEIVDQTTMEPTQEELDALGSLSLAPRFRNGYSLQELAVKSAHLVARRADAR